MLASWWIGLLGKTAGGISGGDDPSGDGRLHGISFEVNATNRVDHSLSIRDHVQIQLDLFFQVNTSDIGKLDHAWQHRCLRR